MMSPVRQEVLQILAELSEVAPEVRFGQKHVVWNVWQNWHVSEKLR